MMSEPERNSIAIVDGFFHEHAVIIEGGMTRQEAVTAFMDGITAQNSIGTAWQR